MQQLVAPDTGERQVCAGCWLSGVEWRRALARSRVWHLTLTCTVQVLGVLVTSAKVRKREACRHRTLAALYGSPSYVHKIHTSILQYMHRVLNIDENKN